MSFKEILVEFFTDTKFSEIFCHRYIKYLLIIVALIVRNANSQ